MLKAYNRSRRMFTKRILEQFQTVKPTPPKGVSEYEATNTRLREFSELLFLKAGCRGDISLSSVMYANVMMDKDSVLKPIISYVAHLAITAFANEKAKPFVGSFDCTVCSGKYSLSDEGHYSCDGCGFIGKADYHGFPNSFPANKAVRDKRRYFHELLSQIMQTGGISVSDAYTLIAFEAEVPVPLAHAGYCTKEKEIEQLINGCINVLYKIPQGK